MPGLHHPSYKDLGGFSDFERLVGLGGFVTRRLNSAKDRQYYAGLLLLQDNMPACPIPAQSGLIHDSSQRKALSIR